MVSFGHYYQNICPLSTWLYHFTQEVESISPALETGFGHFFGQWDISKYDTSRGLRSTCILRFAHCCCSLKSWAQCGKAWAMLWETWSSSGAEMSHPNWSTLNQLDFICKICEWSHFIHVTMVKPAVVSSLWDNLASWSPPLGIYTFV